MNSQIKVIGLLIAFVLMNLVVRAQVSSQVKGIVRNENNELLAGVSVIVRNTKNNFTRIFFRTAVSDLYRASPCHDVVALRGF